PANRGAARWQDRAEPAPRSWRRWAAWPTPARPAPRGPTVAGPTRLAHAYPETADPSAFALPPVAGCDDDLNVTRPSPGCPVAKPAWHRARTRSLGAGD